jgi:hypothetical protein
VFSNSKKSANWKYAYYVMAPKFDQLIPRYAILILRYAAKRRIYIQILFCAIPA